MTENPIKELALRIAALRSRGEIKALGMELDQDEELRALALELAAQRAHDVEPDVAGKRLVRILRDRAAESQVRTNPIHVDEAFACSTCGLAVERGGTRVRDHCPKCIHGLHVDVVPGDRAAGCGGVLVPVEVQPEGRAGLVIQWACQRCGHRYRGRAHPDDHLPGGKLPGRP
jgi:rubrerythrin